MFPSSPDEMFAWQVSSSRVCKHCWTWFLPNVSYRNASVLLCWIPWWGATLWWNRMGPEMWQPWAWLKAVTSFPVAFTEESKLSSILLPFLPIKSDSIYFFSRDFWFQFNFASKKHISLTLNTERFLRSRLYVFFFFSQKQSDTERDLRDDSLLRTDWSYDSDLWPPQAEVFSVCTHACLCSAGVHLYVCVYICTPVWRIEDSFRCCPQGHHLPLWDRVSLHQPELTS